MSFLLKLTTLALAFCFSLSAYSDYQISSWERNLRAFIQEHHYRDTAMNELDYAFTKDMYNENLIFFNRIADDNMSDQMRIAMYVLFLNKMVSERKSRLVSSLLERAEEFGILQNVLNYEYGVKGGTVLHLAIMQQELKIVKTFLGYDLINLGIKNAQNKTPLDMAEGFVPASQKNQPVGKKTSKALQIFQLVSEKTKQFNAQSPENPQNGCGRAFNPDPSPSSSN